MAKKQTKKPTKRKPAARMRPVVVGNEKYGLFYGFTADDDDRIIRRKAVRLKDCRHISYWYCAEAGGITSLARIGPDPTKKNRIAGPADSLLTGVVNVYDVTPEGRAAFDSIKPSA